MLPGRSVPTAERSGDYVGFNCRAVGPLFFGCATTQPFRLG